MEPIKLLPLEIAMYEGIKAGKTLPQIRAELDGKSDSRNIAGRITWMVNNGVIIRHGHKKKSTYSTADITYVKVARRLPLKEEKPDLGPDTLLIGLETVTLNDIQMQFLRANYKRMTRTELSKKLSVSRLELAHIMHREGLKQPEKSKSYDKVSK